jgi:hypothetical protein
MAFKMRNAGGTFKSMGSSPAKTGHMSTQKTPQGEDLIAGDKNFTKKEQLQGRRLEDKNNDAAARREYMEMMKAKKSPTKAKGDPVKTADTKTQEGKQALIDNAMDTANVNALGSTTMSRLKKVFGNVNPTLEEAKTALKRERALNGDSNNLYAVLKSRFPGQFGSASDRIRAQSALKDRGHGRGDHSSQHTRQEKIDKNNPIGAKRKGSDREKETKRKYEAKKGAASEAMNNLHESYMKQGDKSQKELSGKDRREQKGLQRKATRAHKQERRADQVNDHVQSKKYAYQDKPTKPSAKKPKPKKQGGTLKHRGSLSGQKTRKFGDKVLKKDLGSGRKKESKENKEARKKDLKKYRQNKGLRGAINARRTGKGKDKI